MTLTGRLLEWATSKFGYETMRPAWNFASRMFARGATGEVVTVQGPSVAIKSIWATIEYPAIMKNPAVTGLRYLVVSGTRLIAP